MLYGHYDECTKVWNDGVLILLLRNYLGNLFVSKHDIIYKKYIYYKNILIINS